ncbi:heparanase-like [Neodiprion virginianus]|uniref:heparanase-like n=1 Tax=Neodiprion virginianus TaxID=2961670 RepID=UPI001EE6F51C|nr:heparanase-like [Neodiprion virginianus]
MKYLGNKKSGKDPQYRNIIESYEITRKRNINIHWYMLGFFVVLLILYLFTLNLQRVEDVTVINLDTRQSIHRRTSTRYLSYGLDTSLLRDMKTLPINDKRFVMLARHLSPAYVRVGGTSADCLFFDETPSSSADKIFDPINGEDISNFTITHKDFLALSRFARKSGARMIFDLNVLLRRPDGSWNYSDAEKIISLAKEHNIELDWQLGNEPNSFHHVFNRTVTATQLASDYTVLRKLLDDNGYESSNLIGPEVNHIGDANHKGELYGAEFLKHANTSVTYFSWHQYYLNGHIATVEDFINRTVFDYLANQINSLSNFIRGYHIRVWLSETSSAWGSGAPNLSDRFVAGFLWLDKLGYSAWAGIDVVTRQSFFGGHYALVAHDLTPNPDWWVSVIYKQFVSERVLDPPILDSKALRLYWHCTAKSALINRVPAITQYGVHLDNKPMKVAIRMINPAPLKSITLHLYVLTADHLQSRFIKMNNQTLMLRPDGKLPPFNPIILDPDEKIEFPPHSMYFLIYHGMQIPACEV